MPSDRFPQLFAGLLALSLALVTGAFAGAAAVRDAKRADDQVTVTGSARRPIESDFVVWRAGITVQRPTVAEAYAELKRHTDRLRAFLRSRGVADSALTVRPVETFAIPEVVGEGRETGLVIGYRLMQWVELRTPDVDGVDRLAQEAGSLIAEGVPLTAPPPEYLFTRLADLRVEMLAAATQDARARAARIAESAGSGLGALRSVRMGVFQITPRHSTEVSDVGINDTSSREKDITAVVRVTFGLTGD